MGIRAISRSVRGKISVPKPPQSTIQLDATKNLRQAFRQAKLAAQALEKAQKHSTQSDLLMAFLIQAKDANQKAIDAITEVGLLLRKLEEGEQE